MKTLTLKYEESTKTVSVTGKFSDGSTELATISSATILSDGNLEAAKKNLKKYSAGSYCENPNVPDDTIMTFTVSETGYTLSDDILVQKTKAGEFLVYEVKSKKNNAGGDNSIYVVEYKDTLSGKCESNALRACRTTETKPSVCEIANKCIY